ATLVDAANITLDATILQARTFAPTTAPVPINDSSPLPDGTLICNERYRLVHLLHRRPRVHHYLTRPLDDLPPATLTEKPLVAIAEVVLWGLTHEERRCVLRGSFEELAGPRFFGSRVLLGVGDQLHIEGDRDYLIMQPRGVRGNKSVFAVPLSEIHLGQPGSPS